MQTHSGLIQALHCPMKAVINNNGQGFCQSEVTCASVCVCVFTPCVKKAGGLPDLDY